MTIFRFTIIALESSTISSCYHMDGSAIWYLFFEFFFYCTSACASVINKNEKNKYHIARALHVITSLSHGNIETNK